jgi:hypothetical protein
MTTRPDLDRFNQIFAQQIREQTETERIGNLVYFFQFRQLHLDAMERGGYDKLIQVFENLQNTPHLSGLAHYGEMLLGHLQATRDPIEEIELKIALDTFIDYIFGLSGKPSPTGCDRFRSDCAS